MKHNAKSYLPQVSMRREDVQIESESVAFQGYFQITTSTLKYRKFEGGWSASLERELFVRRPVAAVLPYDPHTDQVVLIEQFRLGALNDQNSPWLLELVAGIIEPGEGAEAMARREMQEEAGLEAQDLISIYNYWVSPGGSSEHLALFCAKVDAHGAGGIHGLDEEHEDIRVHVVEADEAIAPIEVGRINNAATIIGLQWLALNKLKLQERWT